MKEQPHSVAGVSDDVAGRILAYRNLGLADDLFDRPVPACAEREKGDEPLNIIEQVTDASVLALSRACLRVR